MSEDNTSEEAQKKEKCDTSLKSFASETSAHGIKNVLSTNRHIITRLVWFLGVVGAMVSLGMTLYNEAIAYYQYPFLTVTHTVPRHEMTFPAVTICNINPYDTSRYEYSEELKNIMIKFTMPELQITPNLSASPYDVILNTSMKELMNDLSIPTLEFLLFCIWKNDLYENCEDLFTSVYTLMGRCYVFNGNVSSQDTINQIGSSSGLRVVFRINQDHGVLTPDYSAGLKIHLNEPYELPDFLSQGFVVSTGHSTNIAITKNEYRFLPHPYKAYGDEACVETSSPDFPIKVNYSHIYSSSACLSECVGEKALNVCNCKYITQPDADQPYCSFVDSHQCFIPIWSQFYFEARTNNTCNCPLPCSFDRYKTRMSTSGFPSLATGKLLVQIGYANSIEQTRNDYGEFRIYYEDLMLHQTKHEPQFTLSSIMATVGGQMGFFLGASLLTVAEFGEFFIFSMARMFKWIGLLCTSAGQRRTNSNVVQVKPIN